MIRRVLFIGALPVAVMLLCSCKTLEQARAQKFENIQTPRLEDLVKAAERRERESKSKSQTPPKPTATAPSEEPAIRNLLEAAESALLVKQLTTPEHDNAFDRYMAVLLLSPRHPKALAGLDQIQLQYVSMAREAIEANRFAQAENFLESARQVDNDSALVSDVAEELRRAKREYSRYRASLPVAEPSFDGSELVFDPRALDRRANVVVDSLHELAAKVRDSGETLLITARNDREGRWMYQMMKEAVPGYRLRGDIQVGRIPKIQLLPPID